jgi:hypothetical protein
MYIQVKNIFECESADFTITLIHEIVKAPSGESNKKNKKNEIGKNDITSPTNKKKDALPVKK